MFMNNLEVIKEEEKKGRSVVLLERDDIYILQIFQDSYLEEEVLLLNEEEALEEYDYMVNENETDYIVV